MEVLSVACSNLDRRCLGRCLFCRETHWVDYPAVYQIILLFVVAHEIVDIRHFGRLLCLPVMRSGAHLASYVTSAFQDGKGGVTFSA